MTISGEPHRISACHRHPSAIPVTGFCPSCLRDRLSYLDSDLRRSKSQSSAKSATLSDIHRKSCDVRPRTSLSLLFQSDDGNIPIVTESNQLGLQRFDKTLIGNGNGNENENEEEEIDAKPMKEHIEFEIESHSKRHSSGLLFGAASIFTQKLTKWRLKQQNRKKTKNENLIRTNVDQNDMFKPDSLIGRRRSCDVEPRLSIDDNPNLNNNRASFDEPRASWDGYMVARTIPRLAPMLSVIENQMIVEDETNSVSESSSSARRNSFDCSSSGKSSGKNRMHVEIDDLKLAATKNVNMEIDVYKDDSKSSGPKNSGSIKWQVLKILGFKGKATETRESGDVESGVRNEVSSEKGLARKSYSYHRSPNASDIRGHVMPFDRTRSVRYSPSPNSFENGLLRFHLIPPLTRKKKPERRNSVLNSQSNARGVSRLN